MLFSLAGISRGRGSAPSSGFHPPRQPCINLPGRKHHRTGTLRCSTAILCAREIGLLLVRILPRHDAGTLVSNWIWSDRAVEVLLKQGYFHTCMHLNLNTHPNSTHSSLNLSTYPDSTHPYRDPNSGDPYHGRGLPRPPRQVGRRRHRHRQGTSARRLGGRESACRLGSDGGRRHSDAGAGAGVADSLPRVGRFAAFSSRTGGRMLEFRLCFCGR